MIEYYEQLSEEEQDDIKHVIQNYIVRPFFWNENLKNGPGGCSGQGVPCMQQAQGISGGIFCSCRNHTAGKSAYGRHVHPGRDTMGRKALQTCHNLYSGVKADL